MSNAVVGHRVVPTNGRNTKSGKDNGYHRYPVPRLAAEDQSTDKGRASFVAWGGGGVGSAAVKVVNSTI